MKSSWHPLLSAANVQRLTRQSGPSGIIGELDSWKIPSIWVVTGKGEVE